MKRNAGILFALMLVTTGCAELFIAPEYANTPTGNFEYLWSETDRRYALFGVKGIDWNAEYEAHRPAISDGMSDDELWAALCGTLAALNDNHVHLLAPGREAFGAGSLNQRPAFPDSTFDRYSADVRALTNLDESAYLENVVHPNAEDSLVYGKIRADRTPGRTLGYILLRSCVGLENELDAAMTALSNADGMILDLRFNPGGEDYFIQWVACCFAQERALFLTSRARNGAGHDDFEAPREWYLEPRANGYAGPVAVLQNAYTHSAAESLVLAFRVTDQAVTVGERTSGAYSNMLWRQLPNGWLFSLSSFLVEDASGVCWEGIGTPPDVAASNTLADIDVGADAVLQAGIDRLML
jgi:carboxyl-terminal processing protease